MHPHARHLPGLLAITILHPRLAAPAFAVPAVGVWQLAGTGSHPFVAAVNRTTTTVAHFGMNLFVSNLGFAAGGTFRYVATCLNPSSAFRSDKFHGVAQSTGLAAVAAGWRMVPATPQGTVQRIT